VPLTKGFWLPKENRRLAKSGHTYFIVDTYHGSLDHNPDGKGLQYFGNKLDRTQLT
jgi:hypothetical protein